MAEQQTLSDPRQPTGAEDSPLLTVRGLKVDFPETPGGPAIDGMDLTVGRGEIVALVGESGSGKSLTALSILGLLPPGGKIIGGSVDLDGDDLVAMSSRRRDDVRGRKVGMIFQQPKAMLDPTARVGAQVAEALRRHHKVGRGEAKRRVVEMLRDVGIPEPARRASAYSYQLSGGMAQRVMIAAALSADPQLLIADEPTTALDVTVQAQILDLLRHKRDTLGLSILLITHDLGIVATIADRVAVMYAGRIVEDGTTEDILRRPEHPYTDALMRASLLEAERGKLFCIPGNVVEARAMTTGCRFLPRCAMATDLGIEDQCAAHEPELHTCETTEHHCRCYGSSHEAAAV